MPPPAVTANREHLTRCLPTEPLWLKQVHGTKTIAATAHPGTTSPEADAIWTQNRDRVCAVMTADCLPILVTDQEGTRGRRHTRWMERACSRDHRRGPETFSGPLRPSSRMARALYRTQGLRGRARRFIRAFLDDDPEAEQAFQAQNSGRWMADLQHLARIKMTRCGISDIYADSSCTYSDHKRFYSFRRDGQTGRMATLIWIAGPTTS